MKSSNRKILSISELNKTVKGLLETEFSFIYVEGEISNFSRPSSGHWYFTLKDEKAQIRCAMFRNQNRSVPFEPKNGQQVVLYGKVTLYEGRGDFQIITSSLELSGDGELRRSFERLKASLQKEGFFDQQKKKAIPKFPKKIAVITSPSGAAIKDIFSVVYRRFPALSMTVIPTQVQGEEAVPQIVNAIETANKQNSLYDLILLSRGGGSLEDLWAFNTEPVAKAIFSSSIPVVSAVGHESDFTISDFVADLRAPTPSSAAEQITPDAQMLKNDILETSDRFIRAARRAIDSRQNELSHLIRRIRHPNSRLNEFAQRLDELERRMLSQVSNLIRIKKSKLAERKIQSPIQKIQQINDRVKQLSRIMTQSHATLMKNRQASLSERSSQLEALSPLATLKRGYAIVSEEANGKIVRNSEEIAEGEKLRIRLSNGALTAEVVAKGKI
ncbi:MAG: exodeoxyribonuclease VII large subunit [Pseudomonadota bacterium]|nr:exodeoxyribonuclease VII large subunit [Pseudomonadota bacterium]